MARMCEHGNWKLFWNKNYYYYEKNYIKINQISKALFKRVSKLILHPKFHTNEEQTLQLYSMNVGKIMLKMIERCITSAMLSLSCDLHRSHIYIYIYEYIVYDISSARVIREEMDPMLSNGSRGTLMSYTYRVAFYCGQPKAHLRNNHAV